MPKKFSRQLLLGLVTVSIGLSGCLASPPTHTAPATLTPTSTARPTLPPAPTQTGIPTSRPTRSPTVTPIPSGRQPLTEAERTQLYKSSLEYLAPTHAEAITVARSLRFLISEGHPSNMCGPLSLAMLRDAGLVDRSVILHDFWLLDPSEPSDQWLLESTFPHHRYLWYSTPESIATFDFAAFPLQAGDLLYLFAGPGGTFDHVIAVTHVDDMGRTFSVTNVNTTEGFIIKEAMLYDPQHPDSGQFHEWTDPDNIHLGLTGRGGFLLWRRTKRLHEENPAGTEQLRTEIDALLTGRGGHWNVAIKKVGGGLVYHRAVEEILSSAPAIEIATALLLFHALDLQGITDYDPYLTSNGIHGHTFRQLLEAMLVKSEPSATRHLADWLGEQLDVTKVLQDWGLYQTSLAPRQSTTLDTATILEKLYAGKIGTPEARASILAYLNERGSREAIDGGMVHTYVEEPPTPGANHAVRLALIESGGAAYVLAIYGSPPRYGEQDADVETLQRAAEETVLAFIEEY